MTTSDNRIVLGFRVVSASIGHLDMQGARARSANVATPTENNLDGSTSQANGTLAAAAHPSQVGHAPAEKNEPTTIAVGSRKRRVFLFCSANQPATANSLTS
ncbi:MAG: hypothetical protein QUV05_09930, partial [Phycisphaerae bacterium]|nr:hypothetical protein [Phycisphaerae bacterium]